MGRNIVLFSDGTGNSAASAAKTNVWRVYDALDLTGTDQIATFDDGVGTSSVSILRILGLALGIGVKRNVLDLYKYLCRTYRKGDRVYMFGFSRGAFTIRVLCGLIARQGLVACDSDEHLDRAALAAYRTYRTQAFNVPVLLKPFRGIRDAFVAVRNGVLGRPEEVKRRRCEIDFVGVWDTVAAYGLPIDELTIAVDRWVWPMRFRDQKLLDAVKVARQALSLDDDRRTFFSIPWDEKEAPRPYGQALSRQRLLQVWFAGVHANVGGGYPDDRLAYVPLVWMMGEAQRFGLHFDQEKLATYRRIASFSGSIYDARAGLGVFYRYQPRTLSRLMPPPDRDPATGESSCRVPLVHGSVIQRMAFGADRYAPISIDTDIDVLAENNVAIPFRIPDAGGPTETRRALARLLEDPDAGAQPPRQPVSDAQRRRMRQERQDSLDRALDLVWWRRLLYFVMLFSLLTLVFLPLIGAWLMPVNADGTRDPAFWGGKNEAVADLMPPFIAVGRMLTPPLASPWLDALEAYPLLGAVPIVLFLVSYRLSGVLRTRIRDWAAAGWSNERRASVVRTDEAHKQDQFRTWLTITVVLLGFTCLAGWQWWRPAMPEWQDTATRFTLTLGTCTLIAGLITLGLWVQRTRHVPGSEPRWWTLETARALRTSPGVVAGYRWFAQKALPAATLAAVAALFLAGVVNPLVSQAVFQVRLLTGLVCHATPATQTRTVPPSGESITVERVFDASDPCWASGLTLNKDRRYEVVLDIPREAPDWFDHTLHTGPRGFAAEGFIHRVSFPLKRWISENWFLPIARIGAAGATEIPLHAIDPPPEARALDRVSMGRLHALMQVQEAWISRSAPISKATALQATALFAAAGQQESRIRALLIAPKSGELFMFVNDAVPNWFADTYANNSGSARVSVRDVSAEWPCTPAEERRRAKTHSGKCLPP
ncbi:MAG: DUF2235 domain-containing protein [Acetobacteraceae bacterium]